MAHHAVRTAVVLRPKQTPQGMAPDRSERSADYMVY
jgi:hypothetical protein